jgi:hypothetical protein
MTIREAKNMLLRNGYKLTEAGSKEQRIKIQQHLLDCYDGDYEALLMDAENYYKREHYKGLRDFVSGGSFLCYYDEQRDFLTDLYHTPAEDQRKYSDDVVFQRYCNLLSMELANLLHNPQGGGSNYLKERPKPSRKKLIQEPEEITLEEAKKLVREAGYRTLRPTHDSRKSFYGKATEGDGEKGLELYSYGKLAAKIVDGEPKLVSGIWNYSQTTLRHVKDWLASKGFEVGTKQQIAQMYEEI